LGVDPKTVYVVEEGRGFPDIAVLGGRSRQSRALVLSMGAEDEDLDMIEEVAL